MRIRHIHSLDTPAHALFSRLTAVLERALGELPCLISEGFRNMADKLDTVIARAEAQDTVIGGIAEVVSTWTDTNAALRQEIVDLQTALGEAGNDTEQVDTILAKFDASDAKLAAIKDKLAPAIVSGTPAEEPGEDTTGEAA